MASDVKNDHYIKRQIERALADALQDTPVVCILGPRQAGKSTLAKRLDPARTYMSLDDQGVYKFALTDPQGFIGELPEYVAIDEIQRVPELALAIKLSVDFNRKPGRFLLTGSANLLQLPRLADSLAGRMELIQLHTLTEAEKEGAPGGFLDAWLDGTLDMTLSESKPLKASSLPRRIMAGGYPEAVMRSPKRARQWQTQYIQTIIDRDIHDISQIKEGRDVARFLEYMAHQTSQLLNVTETAKALGHTRATIEKYLAILEKLYLLRQLPAWHRNTGKRLIKSPKVHICDSGLAAALVDVSEEMWIHDRSRFGPLLESFVIQQISSQAGCVSNGIRLWHYRDKDKVEVDCVLTRGRSTWGVEVKAASSIKAVDAKGLRRLAEQTGKDFQGGIVLYDGASILPIDRDLKLYAVPISKFWEL